MKTTISRRDFIKGTMAGALTLSAAGVLGACSSEPAQATNARTSEETSIETSAEETAAQNDSSSQEAADAAPVLTELAIPEEEALEQTEYSCDVLVVGGGFAGLFAALQAKEEFPAVFFFGYSINSYSFCAIHLFVASL